MQLTSSEQTTVAQPSEKDREYAERAHRLDWPDVNQLWEDVKSRNTPDWDNGRAFEHLVIRAFQLDGLEVEYSYHVPPHGNPLEQIDGVVYSASLAFLVECKDERTISIDAIAKLRNQILRRPETTMGCLFTSGRFTPAAMTLADFAVPHRMLLWSEQDIEIGIRERRFAGLLQAKYRHLCKYGLTDHSPLYREFEV